jgi:hypothetical protein
MSGVTRPGVRVRSNTTLLRDVAGPPDVIEELRRRLDHYTKLLYVFRFPTTVTGQYDPDHFARTYGVEPVEAEQQP